MPVAQSPVMAHSQGQAAPVVPDHVKHEPTDFYMIHNSGHSSLQRPVQDHAHGMGLSQSTGQPVPVNEDTVNRTLPGIKPSINNEVATASVKVSSDTLQKDPIDIASVRGRFGWATVDGVNVPYLLREDRKYVAVRIVEQKLLARFPNTFPEELGEHEPLVSYYVTQNELKLLDEINSQHCNFDYGRDQFTNKDLIVKLSEFEAFYNLVKRTFPQEVLEARKAGVPLPPPAELALCKSGWIQVNNTVTPYFRRDTVKYVVLQIIKHAAKLLTDVDVESILPDEDEYKLINDMCKRAGLVFQFAKNTRLVSLEDVKNHHTVALMELPMDAPMKHAQYNIDNKQTKDDKKSPKQNESSTPVLQVHSMAPSRSLPNQQAMQYNPQTAMPSRMQTSLHSGQQHSPVPTGQNVLTQPRHAVMQPYGANPALMPPRSQFSGHTPTPRIRLPNQHPYLRHPAVSNNVAGQMRRPPPPYSVVSERVAAPRMNIQQIARPPLVGNMGPILSSQVTAANQTTQRSNFSQSVPVPVSSQTGNNPHQLNMTSTHHSLGTNAPVNFSPRTIGAQQQIHNASVGNAAIHRYMPQMIVPTPQQSPAAPTQTLPVRETIRSQVTPNQQTARYVFPVIDAAAINSIPQMNNILQRPPFRQSAPNQVHPFQRMAPAQSLPVTENSIIRGNMLKQALNTPRMAILGQPSSHQVPGAQEMQTSQTISSSPSSHLPNRAIPPSVVQGAYVSPPAGMVHPGSGETKVTISQPGIVQVPSAQTSIVMQESVGERDYNPKCQSGQAMVTVSPPDQTNPASGLSNKDITLGTNLNSPANPSLKISRESPDKSSESKTHLNQNTEVASEALEVVKISECVSGVKFEGKSISCLEYENLKGKHALVEAVCKLYFSQCTINEFLFALEQVLKVPTTACQPNEEKAFIHYYRLPVPVLKCNKMVKLDDLSKYYPQLSYMFSKKNETGEPLLAPGNIKTDDASGDAGDTLLVLNKEEQLKSEIGSGEATKKNVSLNNSSEAAHSSLLSSALSSESLVSVRPTGAAKRKHYSGSGQPSKQPKRLEDAVERLKQRPDSNDLPNTIGTGSDSESRVEEKPNADAEDSVIVIE